jgi:hypothetical protein
MNFSRLKPVILNGSRGIAAGSGQMSMIKKMRELTGAPMMEVKTALEQANWDGGTFSVW